MFNVALPPKRKKLVKHSSQIALALALFLLVCQVHRWFTARRLAQTRTLRLTARCHPLITRRVITCCSLSSFQRTDPAFVCFRLTASARLRRGRPPELPAFPRICTIRLLSQPSLGEPSKVTTEDLACQPLRTIGSLSISYGAKKIAPVRIRSIQSGDPAGNRYRLARESSIYAPGVGIVPHPASRRQRILAEQECRAPNPARAI